MTYMSGNPRIGDKILRQTRKVGRRILPGQHFHRGNITCKYEDMKTMAKAMADAGASGEEIAKAMDDALKASGASAEDIAKTVVQQNLMAAMGKSSNDLAKEFLAALRSGDDLDLANIHSLLLKDGIDADAAMKILRFQKALATCGSNPEDVAKAVMLQKAWLNGYENSPTSIAKCLEDIIADSKN